MAGTRRYEVAAAGRWWDEGDSVRRVRPRRAAAAGRRGAGSRPAWRRVDPRP
ncbi:hypothetical protein [Streptomyces sp. CB09001]|uniref:hypothetical protein n=1 Tax=Streptomyces sp. CB09001 TaxID=2083284 RepID=UPI001965441D|nr:hypothetical protein [Streptomyces sp. CB09001]